MDDSASASRRVHNRKGGSSSHSEGTSSNRDGRKRMAEKTLSRSQQAGKVGESVTSVIAATASTQRAVRMSVRGPRLVIATKPSGALSGTDESEASSEQSLSQKELELEELAAATPPPAVCSRCGAQGHYFWQCANGPQCPVCSSADDPVKGGRSLCPSVLDIINPIRAKLGRVGPQQVREAIMQMKDGGHRPSLDAYALLMGALAARHQRAHAEALLDEMRRDGVRPDAICYNAVLNGWCEVGRIADAERVLARMRAHGCAPVESTYNILCKGYGVARRPQDALRVLEAMAAGAPPWLSSSTSPGAHVRRGDGAHGVATSAAATAAAAASNGASSSSGAEEVVRPSVRTYNTVINSWCEEGGIEEARKLMAAMRSANVAPDVCTYNTLIKAYAKLKQPDNAERLLREMENAYLHPNERTFAMLASCLCEAGRLDGARALVDHMRVRGVRPNSYIFNALVKGYARAPQGPNEGMDEVLALMHASGVPPDVATYGIVMNAWSSAGEIEKARRTLEHMRADGIAPDLQIWSVLAKGYARAGRPEKAEAVLEEMAAAGVPPNVVAYTTVISGWCTVAKMDDAYRVLRTMQARNIMPNALTVSTLVWGFAEAQLPRRAEEVLAEMFAAGIKPEDKTLDMAANAWRKIGKHDQAARLLALYQGGGPNFPLPPAPTSGGPDIGLRERIATRSRADKTATTTSSGITALPPSPTPTSPSASGRGNGAATNGAANGVARERTAENGGGVPLERKPAASDLKAGGGGERTKNAVRGRGLKAPVRGRGQDVWKPSPPSPPPPGGRLPSSGVVGDLSGMGTGLNPVVGVRRGWTVTPGNDPRGGGRCRFRALGLEEPFWGLGGAFGGWAWSPFGLKGRERSQGACVMTMFARQQGGGDGRFSGEVLGCGVGALPSSVRRRGEEVGAWSVSEGRGGGGRAVRSEWRSRGSYNSLTTARWMTELAAPCRAVVPLGFVFC